MFVAAGITNIINTFKKNHGGDFSHFSDYVAIHTNDTHPALCGIELMRKLIDEEKVEWEDAWQQMIKTISFTNHTVLPEASETWDVNMFRKLLPRHFTFIEEIDKRFRETFPRDKVNDAGYVIQQTCIIGAGKVRMANLSIICSYSVNGVAKLHTQILKDLTLHNFYEIYPEKFNNKTNGISHRRFLAQSNPGLKKLLDNTLGNDWIANIERLGELEGKINDTGFLHELDRVKTENKIRLANYVKNVNGQVINPNTIFDIQVKRFHAYKRQQLNVLKIIELYFNLKEDSSFKIEPTTFIFSGKAAQGYDFAKDIIRLIHSVADVVNNDPAVNEIIKVCFVPNFNVSNAQIIYPACDISEQISTAGKEASGTGNMKFMMNGAFTLGTLDGANIEISEQVGDDNIKIFGLKANEIEEIKNNHSYYAYDLYNNDQRIKRLMDTLVNDTFGRLSGDFYLVFDEILRQNDEYFVLKDFASYMDAWHYVNNLYASNKEEWLKKSLINISKSAFFSSDRTIKEYASEIWHI
jgi:starch phosphorylase